MTQIIQSGAFLQQCWSVHPLCLTVKRMTDDRTVVLTCSACRFTHHLSVVLVTPMHTAAQEQVTIASGVASEPGDVLLNRCIAAHREALSLREMDVFHDLVRLRCADCRRHYEVTVSAFKTHQR